MADFNNKNINKKPYNGNGNTRPQNKKPYSGDNKKNFNHNDRKNNNFKHDDDKDFKKFTPKSEKPSYPTKKPAAPVRPSAPRPLPLQALRQLQWVTLMEALRRQNEKASSFNASRVTSVGLR